MRLTELMVVAIPGASILKELFYWDQGEMVIVETLRGLTKKPWIGVLLGLSFIAFHVGLVFDQARRQSATYDEPVYASSGYAFIVDSHKQFLIDHPPAIKILLGASWLGAGLPPLETVPGYKRDLIWTFAPALLYGDPTLTPTLLLRARSVVLLLSVLLACGVWLLAQHFFGKAAGILALAIYCFDPQVVALAGLATLDMPSTALIFIALALSVAALNNKRPWFLFGAGLAVGLALASKVTAVIILPVLCLLVVASLVRRGGTSFAELRGRALSAAIIAMIAGNIFTIVCLPEGPAIWWEALKFQHNHAEKGHLSYFLGQYSDHCWPLYFPLGWLIKTPIPIIVAALCGICFVILHLRRAPDMVIAILAVPVLIFAGATVSGVCNGVRQIFPIVPFLAVAGGAVMAHLLQFSIGRVIVIVALHWLGIGTLANHPNAITYSNEIAGGPKKTWQLLSDANVDWGQGLPQLAEQLRSIPYRRLWLEYFGTALPSAHGVNAYHRIRDKRFDIGSVLLETDKDGPDPSGRDLLAISATSLVDMYISDHELHAWLRERKPIAWAGNSIAIFDITDDAVAYEELAQMATKMLDPLTEFKAKNIAFQLRKAQASAGPSAHFGGN
ncbi:MAG: glycosyltransferase family 39 protein [Deltaproteobacteria bacterium]|nr:glycosyltransferase family 39 protein [Deltaproteobacteria bacterium]